MIISTPNASQYSYLFHLQGITSYCLNLLFSGLLRGSLASICHDFGIRLSFFYEMRCEEKITLFIQHPIITLPSTKYRIKKKKIKNLNANTSSLYKQARTPQDIHTCMFPDLEIQVSSKENIYI